MNAMNSSNLPLPHHSIDEIQQHQPAGIWDLPMPPAGVANPPVGKLLIFKLIHMNFKQKTKTTT